MTHKSGPIKGSDYNLVPLPMHLVNRIVGYGRAKRCPSARTGQSAVKPQIPPKRHQIIIRVRIKSAHKAVCRCQPAIIKQLKTLPVVRGQLHFSFRIPNEKVIPGGEVWVSWISEGYLRLMNLLSLGIHLS